MTEPRLWGLGSRVSDLRRERQFLLALGAEVVLDDPLEFRGRAYEIPLFAFGGKYLHVGEEMVYDELRGQQGPRGLCHAVFQVDDLQWARSTALANGATEVAPVASVDAAFGQREVAFVMTPGGALFEFAQIHEHRVPDV